MKKILSSLVICVLAHSNAAAQPVCEISEAKRVFIESVLCGQASNDKAYQEYGSGCARTSITKRLEDSAKQVILYRECGFKEFSIDLEKALVRSIKFMEKMAICISEEINIDAIMMERTEYVKTRAAGFECNAELRALAERRRPFFAEMIAQSRNENIWALSL